MRPVERFLVHGEWPMLRCGILECIVLLGRGVLFFDLWRGGEEVLESRLRLIDQV